MKKQTFYGSSAWRWFSRYIMLSHARVVNGEYKVECITCKAQKKIPGKMAQAGHYIKVFTSGGGSNFATAFDEKNVAPQCYGCNTSRGGNQGVMGVMLDQMYGTGTSDSLLVKSKTFYKLDKVILKDISDEYRLKFKELAKIKGDPWR